MKKFTDEQIIKAMQCVIGNGVSCSECEYQKALPFPSCRRMCAEQALDLINRQKAEKERLLQKLQQAKSEAIKEFAERLKRCIRFDDKCEYNCAKRIVGFINYLIKEMTEEK